MFTNIYSGAIYGVGGRLVTVEADIGEGFPSYTFVGYLASEVKEARERVTTALKNSGYHLPAKKIIINLSPAGLRKQGTAYDLPIALALLGSLKIIPKEKLNRIFAIGELSLNGDLCPVRGVLPLVSMAKAQGISTCLIPEGNGTEAALVEGIQVVGIPDIKGACIYFMSGETALLEYCQALKERREGLCPPKAAPAMVRADRNYVDFKDVIGQEHVKRAIAVAAAGMHHLLMIGPPGSGKSMCARAIPGIMPPMTLEECMEVTKLYSVAGLLEESASLIRTRPFRSPHHTVPVKTMIGGGNMPVPGEVTLAHRGVLFLDELAEFAPAVLEVLRQPLEEGAVTVSRLHGSFSFPANFMLVAAMNPCKCGYYPDRSRCHCTSQDVYKYLHRISRPLWNRMDVCVDASPVYSDKSAYSNKKKQKSGLSSLDLCQMVAFARTIQQERFAGTNLSYNSEIPAAFLKTYCPLTKSLETYFDELSQTLDLSMRGKHKLLRVARTIADLEGQEILEQHLNEAAGYRMAEQSYWEF